MNEHLMYILSRKFAMHEFLLGRFLISYFPGKTWHCSYSFIFPWNIWKTYLRSIKETWCDILLRRNSYPDVYPCLSLHSCSYIKMNFSWQTFCFCASRLFWYFYFILSYVVYKKDTVRSFLWIVITKRYLIFGLPQ